MPFPPNAHRVNLRFACGDNYGTAFAPFLYAEVVEGTFMPDTFGVTYAQGPTTPQASQGIALAVGQPLNAGPTTVLGAGFRLNEIFFRNTTPGSNGFVTFQGVVRDLVPGVDLA